ncbi:hypothetical protein D9Q98_007336 [Chlorella vulgaris]|uniref:Uncharacterized protein n=1 Tax=Chlorella vulgaris TaxID=3077 RepID=A0A9D4TL23_CHLVU|nr:hypothetical protein D9Q98_007336 [Chlorella vulgaris]
MCTAEVNFCGLTGFGTDRTTLYGAQSTCSRAISSQKHLDQPEFRPPQSESHTMVVEVHRVDQENTAEVHGMHAPGQPTDPAVQHTGNPEVQAALAGRASPEWRLADEKQREAHAAAQGGRWLDDSNMPRAAPNQIDQPDVVAALAAANTPEAKAAEEHRREARAAAQGGRWA